MESSAEVPSLGYLVWRLSLRWQNELGRALAPLGITPPQYAVLASLVGLSGAGGRPSQRELADMVGLEPMYVSRLARTLEHAGLVQRAVNPRDSRAVQMVPTEAGVEVVQAARRQVRRLEEQRLAVLGGRDSRRVETLASALRALLHDADEARDT